MTSKAAAPAILALPLSPVLKNGAAPAILALQLSPAVLTHTAAPAILATAKPLGLDALGAERVENARHAGLLVENAHQLIAAGASVIGQLSL
jgi:hypothetical protein